MTHRAPVVTGPSCCFPGSQRTQLAGEPQGHRHCWGAMPFLSLQEGMWPPLVRLGRPHATCPHGLQTLALGTPHRRSVTAPGPFPVKEGALPFSSPWALLWRSWKGGSKGATVPGSANGQTQTCVGPEPAWCTHHPLPLGKLVPTADTEKQSQEAQTVHLHRLQGLLLLFIRPNSPR